MALPRIQSADALFAIEDRPAFEVEIPQWEGSVLVRQLDARTMALIQKATTDDEGREDKGEFAARVVMEGCVEPKFEPHHLERLRERNNSAFIRIFNAIMLGPKKKGPLKN